MNTLTTYRKQLDMIRGKTIAVVYIFENENASGFQHYWIWKSDIITGWLNAIQELECIPYIMDVRTFIQKTSNNTLPHVDFVLNLNCGSYNLSSMALVPSMCSFLSIPCIPCDAAAIIMSENKNISNILANAKGLLVPITLPDSNKNGIFRPLNLGSSIGIKIGEIDDHCKDGLYQAFIPGYDVTIPIMYNPIYNELDLLPPLLYMPNSNNPNWIYDLHEKYAETENFVKLPISTVDESLKETIIKYANIFPIKTFGRIDARLKCVEKQLSKNVLSKALSLENLYFVEINSMPTIEYGDSFEMAYEKAKNTKNHSFFECINAYCEYFKYPTMIGFILSTSIIAMSQSQTD